MYVDKDGKIRPRLLQRVLRPEPGKHHWHSFGGGLHNGGIPDALMAILDQVFRFDYMGAAEYEHGAVPEFLHSFAQLAEAGKIIAGALKVPANRGKWTKEGPTVFQRAKITHVKLTKEELTARAALPKTGIVYYLCPAEHQDKIQVFIKDIAKYGSFRRGYNFKDRPMLDSMLGNDYQPQHALYKKISGWLVLNHDFMFFVDEHMFTEVAKLYKIQTPALPKLKRAHDEDYGKILELALEANLKRKSKGQAELWLPT